MLAGGGLLYKGVVSNEVLSLDGKVIKVVPMPKPRAGALVFSDHTKGTTTLIGGVESDGKKPALDLVFSETTNAWSEAKDASLDFVRSLPNPDAVMLFDGAKKLAVTNKEALVYEPGTRMWRARIAFSHDHSGGSAIALDEGKILVVGGLDETNAEAELCTIPNL